MKAKSVRRRVESDIGEDEGVRQQHQWWMVSSSGDDNDGGGQVVLVMVEGVELLTTT